MMRQTVDLYAAITADQGCQYENVPRSLIDGNSSSLTTLNLNRRSPGGEGAGSASWSTILEWISCHENLVKLHDAYLLFS